RKLQHIKFSAKSTSGVFYSLAADYNYSFFKAVEKGFMSQEIRDFVSTMMDNWHNSFSQKRIKIKTIRQKLVSDETYEDLINEYQLNWANSFEEHNVQANISCLHGDLHGENILIDVVSNRATLIDYGDVSEGSLTIDPITLECSFLFHPATIKYDWPTKGNIDNWENLELYLEGCPIAEDIRFCRAWGQRVQAGNRELAACLYSYSLRQLKYKETNKEIALGLLQAAIRIYDNS
ncbi:MAG TPA: response regulator, partial [Shewanella frigidimarina]|nr:response regulator [Shewanella frigidimarina]